MKIKYKQQPIFIFKVINVKKLSESAASTTNKTFSFLLKNIILSHFSYNTNKIFMNASQINKCSSSPFLNSFYYMHSQQFQFLNRNDYCAAIFCASVPTFLLNLVYSSSLLPFSLILFFFPVGFSITRTQSSIRFYGEPS